MISEQIDQSNFHYHECIPENKKKRVQLSFFCHKSTKLAEDAIGYLLFTYSIQPHNFELYIQIRNLQKKNRLDKKNVWY